MGVLADWQIEREGIISPFLNAQRQTGVITYGVTSYGYDVRAASVFKVFSAIRGAGGMIDPKKFRAEFLEEIDTEKPSPDGSIRNYCVIPPNAFALAYTVEKISVPRDCLAIVLGKSTYARCFTGDTRIALVDGTSVSFEEMVTREASGEMFWGYGINNLGRIAVTQLVAARCIGTEHVVAVRLDNDEIIRCTRDHKFATRDGRWVEASSLHPGDSLMPLYRTMVRGYEAVYQPLNGFLYPTHRLADEWNINAGIYENVDGTHRHHKDHIRTNNNPWNIERMEASAHIRHHNMVNYGVDFDPDEHGEAIKTALLRLSQDPEWMTRYSRVQSERSIAFWHSTEHAAAREAWIAKRKDVSAETRARLSEAQKRRYEDNGETRRAQSEMMKRAWSGDEARRAAQSSLMSKLKTRHYLTNDTVLEALHQTGSVRAAARLLGCDRSVFRNYPSAIEAFRVGRATNNHKVVSVNEVIGKHDVYCLTAPGFGNFALESGAFVANCGLVVNCTPLEPAWTGHVTMELSNTTPLPIMVYANEGIGQLVFLRADGNTAALYEEATGRTTDDEEAYLRRQAEAMACRTSYADKGGRYQDQQANVVLPCVRQE